MNSIRKWLRPMLWLIIVGCPVWALLQLAGNQETEQTDWLLQQPKVETIEKSIAATGQLEPKHYVDVGAQVSGQIGKLYVEEGDSVQAGQLLVDIDASVFQTQVQVAEAELANKKASLRQQQAELALAEHRLKRNEALYSRHSVSEDDLMESRTNVAILKAKVEAINAQIAADEASLQGDKVTLSYATIVAPIDGVVVDLQVREGQTINASQNAPELMTIINLDEMTLRAEVSEADVSKLSLGMPVYFSTLGEPERYWHSSIRQILASPEEVNDVVLYQILIDIENPNHELMDSMTTQVFFVEEKADNALVVPLGALKQGPRGQEVLIMVNDHIEPRPVKVGIQNRTQVQILSGVTTQDQVITGSSKKKSSKTTTSALGGPMGPPPGGPHG